MPAEIFSHPALPVRFLPGEVHGPKPGTVLCLSGGGYRAMLFHLGAILRLNEAGLLATVDRISSVSGGSITAGVLAMNWGKLRFDDAGRATQVDEMVTQPIRNLARKTIDLGAVVRGLLFPGSVADQVARSYRKHLFGDTRLSDLPATPDFIFNATNVQTGALWRFSRASMGDWRVGLVRNPTVDLAVAVAASSGCPPFLSPVSLHLTNADYEPHSGADLQREPFTTRPLLTDGGVYDNLGLESGWKEYQTVLVSDAGGHLPPQGSPGHDWGRHTVRVLNVIDSQVVALRKRQLISSYEVPAQELIHRQGVYWGIRSDITSYRLPPIAGYPFTNESCPTPRTLALAATPTRLKSLPAALQERIINWGYAICDVAIRKHVDQTLAIPKGFPYPTSGV